MLIIHKTLSNVAYKIFPKNFFDWIFVDGNHSQKSVYEDMTNYYDLLKDDGFFLCHDYCNHDIAEGQKYGVIEAVNQFIKERKMHPILMSLDDGFPTIFISKYNGIHVHNFIEKLITKFTCVMDINNDIFFSNHYLTKRFWINSNHHFVYCLE